MFRTLGEEIGKRAAKKAVDEFINSDSFEQLIEKILQEELRKPKYAWFRFIKHMQARLLEVDKSLSHRDALQIARNTYREYLRDEKIEFGDPRYDWSRGGARDVIQAYEIDHWEAAP